MLGVENSGTGTGLGRAGVLSDDNNTVTVGAGSPAKHDDSGTRPGRAGASSNDFNHGCILGEEVSNGLDVKASNC